MQEHGNTIEDVEKWDQLAAALTQFKPLTKEQREHTPTPHITRSTAALLQGAPSAALLVPVRVAPPSPPARVRPFRSPSSLSAAVFSFHPCLFALAMPHGEPPGPLQQDSTRSPTCRMMRSRTSSPRTSSCRGMDQGHRLHHTRPFASRPRPSSLHDVRLRNPPKANAPSCVGTGQRARSRPMLSLSLCAIATCLFCRGS